MSSLDATETYNSLTAQVPGSTPALFEWIRQQQQLGFSTAALLQSLEKSGWNPSTAQQAIALLQAFHAEPSTPPSPVPMPAPDLHHQPCVLDAGDRSVQVLMSMQHPKIVLFGNVLSDAECDAIIAAAQPQMARSRTVETKTGGEEINVSRTSAGMFFQRGQTPEVQRLEERLARLLHWPIENGEGLQVLHYMPGAEYKPHHDYFDPAEPGTTRILQRGGQRVGTVVIYLNETEGGGSTFFPEIGLRIHPRRGHAVFFAYEKPSVDTLTLHGGDPVIAGSKWIATKWLREREFQ